MVKVTFTVDEGTVATLRATALRLDKPQSLVVREAVAEYAARTSPLSEVERRRTLRLLDALIERPPTKSQPEADAEVQALRQARRQGGRRRRAE